MKILLNTEEKGEYFFLMTPEGGVLFSPEDMEDIGFEPIPQRLRVKIADKEYIPLNSLYPQVKVEIDDTKAVLYITADPDLLKAHVIDLSRKRPEGVLYTQDNSALLNYRLNYQLNDNFEFTSLDIPYEAGISVNGYVGLSNFSYTRSDTDERLVRLMTRIIRDNPERLTRFILGDFSAISGNLGGGGTFGGVSISKNFSIDPYLVRFPGFDLSGLIETPSDVEVYVNDILIKSERFSPGRFEFLNLPVSTGSGEMSVVIRDSFGREKRITTPIYLSSALLSPGLYDYSYNIGFKREAFGDKSFEYGDTAFAGYHRFGLSRTFTGGFRVEIDKDVVNIGTEGWLILYRSGEINASFALSTDDGNTGYGVSLSYLYSNKGVNLRLSTKGLSREYANLNIPFSQDKPRFEGSISIGYNHKSLGSVFITYLNTDRYTGTDIERLSLSYSKRLTRNTSMYLRADRTEIDEIVNTVFAGISIFLDRQRSANLNYQTQGGKTTESVSLHRNPPSGTGLGYRFILDRIEDSQGDMEIGGNASIQYRGHYGIYSSDYRRSGGNNSYNLSVSGALVFIERAIYLSRPVTDTFALVRVGDIKGVGVSLSNQEVGITNKSGEVIVPGLISYYDNRLSINDRDIPVNYEIKEIRRYVSTPYRSGGVVSFEINKIQGFMGRFLVMEQGKETPAEYWGFEIQIGDRKIETIVGKDGDFYIENIPAGSFPARLFLKEKACKFDIVIPDSTKVMVDMGDITCEM